MTPLDSDQHPLTRYLGHWIDVTVHSCSAQVSLPEQTLRAKLLVRAAIAMGLSASRITDDSSLLDLHWRLRAP